MNPVKVMRLKKEMDTNKAHGPDGILPFVIRECMETLAIPPMMLLRISLNDGNVPTQRKRANVVPMIRKKNM